MARGDIQGRAVADPRQSRAKAVCDYCGTWTLHSELRWQYEWNGVSLYNQRLLACYRCISAPQPQNRTPIIPPNPVPIADPRPETFVADQNLYGFSQYQIEDATAPGQFTKAQVLSAAAQASGIPTPGGVIDRSVSINAVNVSQSLMAANAARSWLLIYNPAAAFVAFSEGVAVLGSELTLPIGTGSAYFWATAQHPGPPPLVVYQGALTVIGLAPRAPVWSWEA